MKLTIKIFNLKLLNAIIVIALMNLIININPKPVQAETVDNGTQNSSNAITELLQNGQELFSSLQQDITSFLNNIKIPDWNTIFGEIFNLATNSEPNQQGQEISQVLENRTSPSYGINADLAAKTQIDTALQLTKDATLSETAQQQLQNTSTAIVSNIESTINLGEQSQQLGAESQNLDVSQQILQNISQQSALTAQQLSLNAETQGVLMQQNQQAQIDRSLNNLLNAQQAQILTESVTTKRRENAATAIATTTSLGLIRMPGLTTNND